MADAFEERPDELARLYAERLAQGFGANLERKLAWTIRDARAALDRRRVRFWERVRTIARSGNAGG